jgi:primary-amine oxidase
LLGLASAVTQRDEPDEDPPKKPNMNEIVQPFPSKGRPQTAWKVRWREERGAGLIIQDAFFKKDPNEDWVQVLGEARLAEAFVPYHRGSPRFWDVSYNFPLCNVNKDDAGPNGKLLASEPGKPPTVVMEVRDRGLAWKDSAGVRRGEQLVLWGSLSAANYRYIIEYTFRDDGLIQFRVGSTGHNYPGSEWEPHMHNALWRVDVNLGGPDDNTVELCEHIEPDPNGQKSQAMTLHTPFNDGKEGAADFDPGKFTMLRVVNTKKKNARGQPWRYDLVPHRMGNSRHYGGSNEECTHHDFWVTKNRKGEILYTRLPEYIKDPQNKQQPEDISNTDVVIWYSDPGHHEPRSEDGEMRRSRNGSRRFQGATPVMWTTFELKPRDFWDRSPYFPYSDE